MSRMQAYVVALGLVTMTVLGLVWWNASAPRRVLPRITTGVARARPSILRPRFVYGSAEEADPPRYDPLLEYGGGDGGVPFEEAAPSAIYDELVDRVCRPLALDLCQSRFACDCATTISDDCVQLEVQACEEWMRCVYGTDPRTETISDPALTRCLAGARGRLAECRDAVLPEPCFALVLSHEDCAEGRAQCWGGVCRDGRCVPAPGLDDGCDELCGAMLECVDGRCAARQSCWDTNQCAAREVCIDGECRLPAREGEACEHLEQCQLGSACEDGVCRSARGCEAPGECGRGHSCVGDVVSRCVSTEVPERCHGDHVCPFPNVCEQGHCVEGPGPGEPCVSERCREGSVCRWVAERGARCAAVRSASVGDECQTYPHGLCGRGLACGFFDDGDSMAGHCVVPGRPGDECVSGTCEPGATCEDQIVDGVCEPTLCGFASIWSCDVD